MFLNREDAALQLAAQLKGRALHDPLVLAIPRGGITLGAILARELGAELDVVLSRKLRAPYQPELAVGAISELGEVFMNHSADQVPGLTDAYLARERAYQTAEIQRRKQLFRNARPVAPVADRSVVVTDDGIATGSTMMAALKTVRAQGPREIIMAVPVASPDRLASFEPLCDEIVCLIAPEYFSAIGQFYDDFSPVEDDEVVALLREFAPRPTKGETESTRAAMHRT